MNSHHHGQHQSGHRHLNIALALTALFAVVELAGGLISGSLALLADAGHMASDVVALAIASLASQIARKPAHKGMTYGYGRAKILAAQINGLALWFLAGWIVWEAVTGLPLPFSGIKLIGSPKDTRSVCKTCGHEWKLKEEVVYRGEVLQPNGHQQQRSLCMDLRAPRERS